MAKFQLPKKNTDFEFSDIPEDTFSTQTESTTPLFIDKTEEKEDKPFDDIFKDELIKNSKKVFLEGLPSLFIDKETPKKQLSILDPKRDMFKDKLLTEKEAKKLKGEILTQKIIDTPAFDTGGLGATTKIAKGVKQVAKSIIPKAIPKPQKQGIFQKLANSEPLKFISSVSRRLKNFGQSGKEILKGFENIDKEKLIRTGTAIDDLDQLGFEKITKQKGQVILDALEGRTKDIPEDVKPLFKRIDEFRKQIAEEASDINLEVKVKGETRKFHPRKNFFPHFIPDDSALKKGKVFKNQLREDVIDNSVRLGKFANKETATNVLDNYVKYVETEGRGGKEWLNYLVESG